MKYVMSESFTFREVEMQKRSLKKIFEKLRLKLNAQIFNEIPDISVSDITSDSRRVDNGSIFVAIRGVSADGHNFINDAVEGGAVAVVVERSGIQNELKIPVAVVDDTHKALVILLKDFWGEPPPKIFATTGTNGKTTVSHILWHIFTECGEKAGVIGTLGYAFDDGIFKKLPVTTPDAESLWRLFAEMRKRNITTVAMEASSHGIVQKRIWGIEFDAAIFTNLTQDHLDYHGNMENYLSAKCELFASLPESSVAVVNIDDEHSKRIIERNRGELLTYGIESRRADIVADVEQMDIGGSSFLMRSPFGNFHIRTNLPGRFNIYNVLAAVGAALARGYEVNATISAVGKVGVVKGRFQRIELGQDFSVIVDYAHTPDALKNLLITAQELAGGRVILVFGAGGDRDRAKRPLMGRMADEYADFSIITSDNPRSEKPLSIIEMIEDGFYDDGKYEKIPDRREAIFAAVKMAMPGDIVLIAGKGHEDYQILGDRIIHFDDAEVARDAIIRKLEGKL